MTILHSTGGRHRAPGWSDSFHRSELGAAVVEVSPAVLPRLLDWAERQPVAHAVRRAVHSPSVQAWALLDGGVLHCYGFGLTTLAGGYVVGRQALRLVAAELALPLPLGATATEDPEWLRRRMRATPRDDPSTVELAELLSSCTDGVLLRWVATTLFAESAPPPRHGRPVG